jgi:transcriptional regulator with XRE-family HTH domain
VSRSSDRAPELGSGLRLLRERRGLSQERLAELIGTNAASLSRIESGSRDVLWSSITRLLDAMGADLHELADAITEAKPSKRPRCKQ